MKTRQIRFAAALITLGMAASAHGTGSPEKQRVKLTIKTIPLAKNHTFLPAKESLGQALKAPKIMQSTAHLASDGTLSKNCSDVSHRHEEGLLEDSLKEVR